MGKLTGMDPRVPTTDVSAVDPTVKIKNRPPHCDLRRGETPLRDLRGSLGEADVALASIDFETDLISFTMIPKPASSWTPPS